ncbi:MAG: hypothetical protein Q4F11_01480 [Eubacteriales bacterium]|nr:hypothetical protein [Eubacteriales bacterium]
MNKKNISLILLGIFMISMRFMITIGPVNIDIANDIIAFIIIIIGVSGVANRNKMFKKTRINAFLGLVFAAGAQILNCLSWGEAGATMHSVAYGLTTVFAIYFSYYFTEALILEAKFQEKSAATSSLNITWLVLSASIFVHFMAFSSVVNTASIIVEAIIGICAIYYCSTVLTACKQLYMDGLPIKHMDI